MKTSKIKTGIVGASGYTGAELVRLLVQHPEVELTVLTSRREAGKAISTLYPHLRGVISQQYVSPELSLLADCDLVFFATPHATAMDSAAKLLAAGVRIIDLSADFRLRDTRQWQQWYGTQHRAPQLLDEAVYGLSEWQRDQIATARLVANPGCYPTTVLLPLLPLLQAGAVAAGSIQVSAVSGLSGAGRELKLSGMLTEAGTGISAYKVDGHRHLAEIEQQLRAVDAAASLTFVPHLAPMSRGMYATVFCTATGDVDITALLSAAYENESFVDVVVNTPPRSNDLTGSNCCRISCFRPGNSSVIVLLSAIDNLVKGAAGQAVQNMNIMFGLTETMGLDIKGLHP